MRVRNFIYNSRRLKPLLHKLSSLSLETKKFYKLRLKFTDNSRRLKQLLHKLIPSREGLINHINRSASGASPLAKITFATGLL